MAMSGGVDSSIAALLLKEKGYDVIGVYMKGWSLTGCTAQDAIDARRVAGVLNIPFYVFNFEEEYKKSVVDYMVSGYAFGITPNPDVMCNKEIKFGLFLEKSLRLGTDYIATGHYVRLQREFPISNFKFLNKSKIKKLKNSDIENSLKIVNCKLKIAKDANKDQSYFLWTLTQNQLKHCLFPIGGYLKQQIRAIANKCCLPTAGKPDSQGVCFVGEINVAEFLKEKIGKNLGPIKTLDGKTIGIHDGAIFYTIGQRKGIGIKGSLPGEQGKIYYVAAKNVDTNTLWVAEGDSQKLFSKELTVKDVNWISGHAPKLPLKCLAKIRYRQPFQKCVIKSLPNINDRRFMVIFDAPQRAITPGQSAVFYLGEKMLGGGIIV